MSRKKKVSKHKPVPQNLMKFVLDKLATATSAMSLAKQATVWYADQKKIDGGAIFGNRDVSFFISLVYRLRAKKSSRRKTGRAGASVKTTPKMKALSPKPMTTFTEALNTYGEYLKLVPRIQQADAFVRQCGLVMVVVNGKATLQLKG